MSMTAQRRRVLLAIGSVFTAFTIYLALGHGHKIKHELGWLPSTGKQCEPYETNGYLNFDPANDHANRWTPFVAGCKSPALFASFIKSAWATQPPSRGSALHTANSFPQAELGPDGEAWHDMEWARGRTVVVFGDSISRIMSDAFCRMAGEPYMEITWNHTWSAPYIDSMPPPMPVEEQVPQTRRRKRDAAAEDKPWLKEPQGHPGSHRPHYCYVPGMDFVLVHMMFFGLDQSQFWLGKEMDNPPYTYEERLEQLAVPIVERIRETSSSRTSAAPELTYVHSGMWDVARFVREDILAGNDDEQNLSIGRLNWYRTRIRQILVKTSAAFPKTSVRWLSTHYPLRISNGWFFDGKRPEIKLNRLIELHHAACSAFQDLEDAKPEDAKALSKVTMSPWGKLMRGMEKHQIDDLHPDIFPGGYLFADMMLYDLQKVVRKLDSWRVWAY